MINNNNNFETLDLITIIGFLAQITNIQNDTEEKKYIHDVIKAIANEVEKLHQENDRIELKLDQILKILKEKEEVEPNVFK